METPLSVGVGGFCSALFLRGSWLRRSHIRMRVGGDGIPGGYRRALLASSFRGAGTASPESSPESPRLWIPGPRLSACPGMTAYRHASPFTRRIRDRVVKLRKNAQTAGRPRLVPWGMCAALRPPCAEICCLEGLFSTPFRPSIELAHGLLKPLRDPNRPSRRQELDTSASGYR